MTSLTIEILGLAISYALLGVLLLSACLFTRLPWSLKAMGIVLTSTFYIVSFYATRGLLGWSSVETDWPAGNAGSFPTTWPAGWMTAGWGTRTATFGTTTDAHTGAQAVTVSVSNWQSGDAKWVIVQRWIDRWDRSHPAGICTPSQCACGHETAFAGKGFRFE